MPIKPVVVQRRMVELGRVRLGQKGPRGEPQRLDTFRFTSASRELLEDIARAYGGTVNDWTDAPDEGYSQVTTDARELEILLPPVFAEADGQPTVPYSQWLELWSGGGCKRRCDGQTEFFTGKDCICAAEGGDRKCKPTTRVSFMLPDIRGFGVWRIESHGWNAAAEMPGTLEVLQLAASEGKFIPAVLRIEQRSSKDKGGTLRYVVPVLDLPGMTVRQLARGEDTLAVNAPRPAGPRPQIPTATLEPARPFELEQDGPDVVSAESGDGDPHPPVDASEGERDLAAGSAPSSPDYGEMALTYMPTPVSTELFLMRFSAEKLPRELISEIGRDLFPGRTLKELDDYDRGVLLAAILTRADQVIR